MRRASAGAREAEHAPDLDELAVDREDRAGDAEIDREEHADGDQRHLRGLEDAEPEDEQRHPGDGGDGAQRLQGRIEQAADRLDGAGQGAEQRCRRRPRCRSPRARATASPRRGSRARRCSARASSVATMRLGGGTRRPLAQAGADRSFPGERDEDRQEKAEKHARVDAGALPGRRRSRESGGSLGRRRSALALVTALSRAQHVSARRWRSGGRRGASTAALTSASAGMTPAS